MTTNEVNQHRKSPWKTFDTKNNHNYASEIIQAHEIYFEQKHHWHHFSKMHAQKSLFWFCRVYFNIHIRTCCLPSRWVYLPCWGAGVIVHCEALLSSPVWLPRLSAATQTNSVTHLTFRVMLLVSVIVSFVCASVRVSAESPPVDPHD